MNRYGNRGREVQMIANQIDACIKMIQISGMGHGRSTLEARLLFGMLIWVAKYSHQEQGAIHFREKKTSER
ncbi:MAG: hypothetical protein NVSMB6_07200 [Burkholderiaceae bacterium]